MNRTANCPINNRTLLGKQPARTLLVDISHSLAANHQVVDDLCNSLENVLSVACNIGGPSRMPLFSAFALTSYPEMLLPLSYVKNNYVRLQQACADLRGTIRDRESFVGDNSCIVRGLQETCAHFQRQTHNSVQPGSLCNQLEVIVITCRKAHTVQKQIEDIASSLALESLKRIQVVVLTNLGSDPSAEDQSDEGASQGSATSSNSGISGLVDIVHLDTDPYCLQNFFNTWLLDSSTDSEHLHIILPPANTGNEELIIKCDLHERILNPAQLPFQEQFTLHPDSATMKTFPTTSKALGMLLPIYRIHMTGLLPVGSLCDSVVFGMPMIAQPTACWKIDWDDLEKNQQRFRSLVYLLLEKNMVILGQMENSLPSPSTKRTQGQPEEKPQGCFVFQPAENGTLLVKSVAVQELLLPFEPPPVIDARSEETVAYLTSSLEKLEKIDIFNPLLWPSRLYECLKSRHKKSDTQQSKKRQRAHSNQNSVVSTSVANQKIKTSSFHPVVSCVTSPSCTLKQSQNDRFQNTFRGSSILPFPTDL